MAEFSAMASRTAKNPAETKKVITEIEERMKKLEETMGKDLDENHAKSVLIGVLDPITRQHTCLKHGQDINFDTLRKLVLEFTSNATDDQVAMQLGSFKKAEEEDELYYEGKENDNEEHLAAFGKGGGMQCYSCGGIGHMSRDCPTKGKGKGYNNYGKSKGKGKQDGGKGPYGGFGKGENGYSSYGKSFGKGGDGKGSKGKDGNKGAGKGPQTGCWNCGGARYASNCPNTGKGNGNLRHFEECNENEWYPEIRPLCCLSTNVKKAFEEKDDWKTVVKVTQGQVKNLKRSAKKVRFEDENKWEGFRR